MFRRSCAALAAARQESWIGSQYYKHKVTYSKADEIKGKEYKFEGITRKLPIPTPNVDPERPEDQLKDHIYDVILKNGQTTDGYLWKHIKPLGIITKAKELHQYMYHLYSHRHFAFKRSPLVYQRRNADTWMDKAWLLRLNEHISREDHEEFMKEHKQRILDYPLIKPNADATIMWYYRVKDDCGFDHGQMRGPVTTTELLQLHSNGEITNDTRCFSFKTNAICWMPFYKYFQLRTRVGEFESDLSVTEKNNQPEISYDEQQEKNIINYLRNVKAERGSIPNYLEHLGYTPVLKELDLDNTGTFEITD